VISLSSTISGLSGTAKTPPVLDRREAKYTVPTAMIGPIEEFIAPYCEPDKYSKREPDGFYTVNSLYFDTPGYLFLRTRMARSETRFNMRMRSYGDHGAPPYFLEIKRKRGDMVRKYRGEAGARQLRWLRHGEFPDTDETAAQDRDSVNRKLFYTIAHTYNAGPKVFTQYRRKAYFSVYERYARVTFDIRLRYAPQQSYDMAPHEKKMTGYDMETIFDPGADVVLELKCYASAVPVWMIDLVRTFGLQRRGFSKYISAMEPVFRRFGPYSEARGPASA
jgi:hypothetical protein